MSIAKPEVNASIIADSNTVGLTAERLLFVGSQNGGSAASGALTTNIGNDMTVVDALFGTDSPIAAAIARARKVNGVTRFDAIGLDDAGGATSAGGVVAFTGTATEAGSITVTIGGEDNEYIVAVADTDTATAIGAALVTLITADAKALVAPVNTTGSVAVTAKTGGLFGNDIAITVDGSVAGVTIALTAMASGATDPTLTGVLDVVGNQRYQGIAWQFSGDTDEVSDFLDARFNVDNNVLDGVAFSGVVDTYANLLVTGAAKNSKSLVLQGNKLINSTTHKGGGVVEVPFTLISEFAAIRALRRTDGATLSDFVIARSQGDAFGGLHTNSKPYFNTPFFNTKVPDVGTSFTDVEIDALQAVGITVFDANRAYNTVIAGRVVTTYTTDVAANPDPTFTALNFVDTATACREYIVNNTRAQYPQYRATGGALIPNHDSANEASVAAFVSEKNAELGEFALVVTGVGTANGVQVDYDKSFQEALAVTLNTTTGAFTVSMKLFIVNQLTGITYGIIVAFEVQE